MNVAGQVHGEFPRDLLRIEFDPIMRVVGLQAPAKAVCYQAWQSSNLNAWPLQSVFQIRLRRNNPGSARVRFRQQFGNKIGHASQTRLQCHSDQAIVGAPIFEGKSATP
jgi:hypothetical protein